MFDYIVTNDGKLTVLELVAKPRGRKWAMTALLSRMERGWMHEISK